MTTYFTYMDCPLGTLVLTSDGTMLTGIMLPLLGGEPQPVEGGVESAKPFREVKSELESYFVGALKEFTVPYRMVGTEFQRKVWKELSRIPYGVTISYRDLAERVGQPTASRAVGMANGRNPIPIIVPCHRVIGANGTLTGYGGGLEAKKLLLDLEANEIGQSMFPTKPKKVPEALAPGVGRRK